MATPTPFASPWTTATLSAAFYTNLLTLTHRLNFPTSDFQTNLKAIGSLHATLTTGLASYALSQAWIVHHPLPSLNLGFGKPKFDDSTNPMIAGHSALGNAVTGLEAGYLLFDTLALAYNAHRSLASTAIAERRSMGTSGLTAAVRRVARTEPLTLFHHLSLLSGLGVLQHFIAEGRERGVYIIVTLLLMNASTPLLHFRWWRRKHAGKASFVLDVALAVVFAGCRVGSAIWVLSRYAAWHELERGLGGVWEAFKGQRWICQLGTGALVGVNGLWLAALVRGIMKRATSSLDASGGATPRQ